MEDKKKNYTSEKDMKRKEGSRASGELANQ